MLRALDVSRESIAKAVFEVPVPHKQDLAGSEPSRATLNPQPLPLNPKPQNPKVSLSRGELQGRSAAKEDKRDRTAFETARREWSQATGISGRGALDGAGDHRSEVWLG